MAGNISKLNLENLYAQIEDYARTASKLGIRECADSIDALSLHWSGQRVNAIINEYNRISKTLYDGNVYFQKTVLDVLGEIYEQYAAMEQGAAKDISGSKTSSILGKMMDQPYAAIKTKLPLTSTTTIKFDATNVNKVVKNIQTYINNTNATLKLLTSKLDALATYSDSLKKLVTTYQSKSKTLAATLTKLETNLLNQVNSAVKTVQSTEGIYNENDVKRV